MKADLEDGSVTVERIVSRRAVHGEEEHGVHVDTTFFDLEDGRFYALGLVDVYPEPDDGKWPNDHIEIVTMSGSSRQVGVFLRGKRITEVRDLDEEKCPVECMPETGAIFEGRFETLESDLVAEFRAGDSD